MINKVILIGNCGADPEVKHLENGAAVARVSIATNESYKDKSGEWQKVTEWHNVVMWRDLAERSQAQLKKGSLVYIEGKLSTRKYTGSDNVERYATDVVASSFRMLEKKDSVDGSAQSFPTSESGASAMPAYSSNMNVRASEAVNSLPGYTSAPPATTNRQEPPDTNTDLPF
jgi:single-strand DNA-binding protein